MEDKNISVPLGGERMERGGAEHVCGDEKKRIFSLKMCTLFWSVLVCIGLRPPHRFKLNF